MEYFLFPQMQWNLVPLLPLDNPVVQCQCQLYRSIILLNDHQSKRYWLQWVHLLTLTNEHVCHKILLIWRNGLGIHHSSYTLDLQWMHHQWWFTIHQHKQDICHVQIFLSAIDDPKVMFTWKEFWPGCFDHHFIFYKTKFRRINAHSFAFAFALALTCKYAQRHVH